MNIYVTGMNRADCNAFRYSPRVQLFQAVDAMIDRLQSSGNTVTWKRTLVGDQIPVGTDAIIASVMLPRSFNCPYALGVMWAISEALEKEIPLVLYLTDWAFFRANTEFRSIARAGTPYFQKKIGNALQYDEPPDMISVYGTDLIDVCHQWGYKHSQLWKQAQILVPRYTNWGDIKIVQRLLPGGNPVLTMDPTPSFLRYLYSGPPLAKPPAMEERIQSWVLPSLLVEDSWIDNQGLQWPIERFGPKGYTVLRNERSVNREYTRRVGALCPPYPTVGSGWWRSRWIHAARARSVLLCGANDGRAVGSAYRHSGLEYENMDTVQLRIAAEEQVETINPLLQKDMGVFTDQVLGALQKAGA